MTRVTKIIFSELKFLFRSIALIGTILVLFIAALLSVISVLIDIPDGFYSGLNDMYNFNTLTVSDIDLDTATEHGGEPIYGTKYGITQYSTIISNKQINSTPSTYAISEENAINQEPTFTLKIYMLTGEGIELMEKYSQAVTKGRLPKENGEMLINSDTAERIGATIGSEVSFSPDGSYVDPDDKIDLSEVEEMKFTVVGISDYTKIYNYKNRHSNEVPIPAAHIYLVSDVSQFDVLCMNFDDSKTLHGEYRYFMKLGKDCKPNDLSSYEMIDTAVAFFGAVTAVLGIMVVFIIYSLIAIFYRQRKGMICRLKLFGATDKQIGFIYCSITVTLILLGVAIGSLIAIAFNSYFIGLCGSLFDTISSNFVSHFRPIVQAIVFIILSLFTIGIFIVFDKRIKNTSISAEVRYE